jgi:hypothetical protein
MEGLRAKSAPSLDPVLLAKLWPNRAHESNWLKDAICALGFHRWYRLELRHSQTIAECSFCRWCPEVKVHGTASPPEITDSGFRQQEPKR